MANTRITQGVIKPNENYVTGVITATAANISGDLTVGGIVTYEDVTSIDSVGIITARKGIVSLGVVTATAFHGDGSQLTGIDATALKDTGGNVKIQAQASGAVHTGISSFGTINVGSGVTIESNGQATFTGIVTFGSSSTTINGNTDTINVGTALTLGHSQGLKYHTQNLHAEGFEVNNINASGIITAAQFSGDGSNLANLPAGLGTALSSTQSSPLNKIYYTNTVLPVETTITVDTPASASAAYTQYADISVGSNADLIISDGDDLIPDVLGLRPDGFLGGGSVGRIRVDSLTNKNASGPITIERGLIVSSGVTTIGIDTTKSFLVSEPNLTTGRLEATTDCVILYSAGTKVARTHNKRFEIGNPSANIGIAATFGITGNALFGGTGIVTASTYYGDGSNLTGISGVTINNNANNRLITGSGTANTLEGEQYLTWDGDLFKINAAGNDNPLQVDTGNSNGAHMRFFRNGTQLHFFGCGAGISLGDSEDLSMRSYDNILFSTDNSSSEKVRITSNGSVNIGNSSQTTHLLYLQSTGDAGIHIRADSDNSGENDNPYLSMSQDGSNAQLFKLGMVGDAGNEFAQSIANAPFVHANTANVQPLQLAHMNNLAVTISAIESSHFHQISGTTIGGMKIANRGNDTGAALLLQGHNNTGTPGAATNTQLTHDGTRLEFEIKHANARAIHVGSSRRIRVPGIVGVAGSGLQTVYVESDGNLCTTSSLREYKTNITTMSDISWLFNLNPVTFNWKKKTEVNGENIWEDTADDNGTQYGLIAEEVEAVKKDFCSYDNNNKLTGVHYDRIITPLIKAVQDLKSEINTLQQENISLRARVTNLEGE